jgi:hypothetical protein
MKDVQQAWHRNKVVEITYHGKVIGTIHPKQKKQLAEAADHPFFGMDKSKKRKEGSRQIITQVTNMVDDLP